MAWGCLGGTGRDCRPFSGMGKLRPREGNELGGTCPKSRSPWEQLGSEGLAEGGGALRVGAQGRGGLGAFTRLTLQLQAPREIPAGDPGLQGHQLLGGVLQEVGDVGLDEAKTAREGLGAGEGDVTTESAPATPQAQQFPCPATPGNPRQPQQPGPGRPGSQRERLGPCSPWLLGGSVLSNAQLQGPGRSSPEGI